MGIAAATSAILVGVAAGGVEYAATACIADAVLMGCVAAGMQVLQKGLPTLLAKTPDVSTGSGSTSTGTTTDPNSTLPVLYGKIKRNNDDNSLELCCETGTVKTWENVDGSYLFQSYAFGNGELDLDGGIYQIYYGDTPLLIDDNSITAEGVVNSSQIASNVRDYVQLEIYFGKSDYSQVSKSLPAQYAGEQWNSSFWGNGVAQIYLVLRKDSDAAEDGLDDILSDNNSLTIQCSGMKIADVRTNVIAATNNPINQIYDYLTNGLYGAAIPPSLIDIASFQSAAEYCDTYGYYSTGCVSSQSSYTDTLNQICSTCGAVLYEKQGKLFVIPDVPSDSVMSVDESMIFGTVNLTTQGINDFFNTVDCQFTNIDNDFSSDTVRFPTELTDTDLAISGGRVIPQQVDLTWCQSTDQICTLGNRMLDKAKYSQTSFTFNSSYMWDVQIFDVIDITFSEFGWNKKLFRVTSKSISTDPTTFGYVQIICVEYWPEVYDGESAGNWSPDSYINPGVNVIAPTDLEVTLVGETTNGYEVLMSWTKSVDPYLMGYYTYYRESGGSGGWIASGSVDKYKTEYYLYGLNPDKTYDFGIKAYNNLSYTSAMCEVDGIIPDYDYQLPSVTGLVLTNKNETPTTTYSNYFSIAWDDQSNLAIGDSGKLFKDYFAYYEIRIYAKDGTYKTSYSTNTTSFTYTYDENNHDGIGRSVIMGIVPRGQSSGTIGEEVTIQVSNEPPPKVLNVSAVSGIGEIVFSWSVDNMPPDWQSITIECSTTDQFTDIKSLTVPACEFAPFVIDDGSYYCRIAGLDFWQDDINWSDTIAVTQLTQIQPSQLSEDCVDAIVDSAQFEEAVTQYINNAGEDIWSLSVEGGTEDDPIIAGVSIGTDTETHTSSFNIMADEFVLVPSSAATTDQWISPFYVENGQVYMQSAIIHDAAIDNAMIQNASIDEAKIADASITSAKIAQSISSDNFVSGSTGWNINRDGSAEFDQVTVRGTVYANDGEFTGQLNATSGQFNSLTGYNSTFTNCTIDSSCVVNGQLYAENIIGDVYQFQSEWNMCSPIDGYIYQNDAYPIESTPVVGTKYVCVKLEGQNFEQKLSGNLGMYFRVGGHIGYKIILGGDGVADQEMFSFFTSNDYEEHRYDFNNMRLPAVGYGKYIYIWVECYQSDHGWSGEVICGCNIHFDQYGGLLQDTPSIALCKYTSDFATNS